MSLKTTANIQPWISLLRGAKESDIVKLYDAPLYNKGNGIYANITEANVGTLSAFLDGVVKSCVLGSGAKLVDENAVRMKDTDITDAKSLSVTLTFDNGMTATPFIAMVKTATIDQFVLALAKLPWKTPAGAILKATQASYKTTVTVPQA